VSSRSVALWAKWWLWGMACCLLATGCSGEGARAADETTAAAVAVEVLSVQEREEALTRRYTGYVHPWQAHGIGFLVGGRVKSILVKEGDKVEKGQLIATMVADDFALTQSLAAVHRDALAPNLERVRTLVEERVLRAGSHSSGVRRSGDAVETGPTADGLRDPALAGGRGHSRAAEL